MASRGMFTAETQRRRERQEKVFTTEARRHRGKTKGKIGERRGGRGNRAVAAAGKSNTEGTEVAEDTEIRSTARDRFSVFLCGFAPLREFFWSKKNDQIHEPLAFLCVSV